MQEQANWSSVNFLKLYLWSVSSAKNSEYLRIYLFIWSVSLSSSGKRTPYDTNASTKWYVVTQLRFQLSNYNISSSSRRKRIMSRPLLLTKYRVFGTLYSNSSFLLAISRQATATCWYLDRSKCWVVSTRSNSYTAECIVRKFSLNVSDSSHNQFTILFLLGSSWTLVE